MIREFEFQSVGIDWLLVVRLHCISADITVSWWVQSLELRVKGMVALMFGPQILSSRFLTQPSRSRLFIPQTINRIPGSSLH